MSARFHTLSRPEPEAEQAEALAKIEVINKRHKAAGTLPTPIPRGAQR